MQFFIADEVEDFAHGEARMVDAPDIQSAAAWEACRLFDEQEVDLMRPVVVVVARDAKGCGAIRYSIRRRVEVTHHIESETEVTVSGGYVED